MRASDPRQCPIVFSRAVYYRDAYFAKPKLIQPGLTGWLEVLVANVRQQVGESRTRETPSQDLQAPAASSALEATLTTWPTDIFVSACAQNLPARAE